MTEIPEGGGAGTPALTDVLNLLNVKLGRATVTTRRCDLHHSLRCERSAGPMAAIEGKPPETSGALHDGA